MRDEALGRLPDVESKQLHSQEPLQCCLNVEERIAEMKLMNVLELLSVPVVHYKLILF